MQHRKQSVTSASLIEHTQDWRFFPNPNKFSSHFFCVAHTHTHDWNPVWQCDHLQINQRVAAQYDEIYRHLSLNPIRYNIQNSSLAYVMHAIAVCLRHYSVNCHTVIINYDHLSRCTCTLDAARCSTFTSPSCGHLLAYPLQLYFYVDWMISQTIEQTGIFFCLSTIHHNQNTGHTRKRDSFLLRSTRAHSRFFWRICNLRSRFCVNFSRNGILIDTNWEQWRMTFLSRQISKKSRCTPSTEENFRWQFWISRRRENSADVWITNCLFLVIKGILYTNLLNYCGCFCVQGRAITKQVEIKDICCRVSPVVLFAGCVGGG